MTFDYFYEEQSESYSFYRIPKVLFTDEMFADLSVEAKVLYGLLLDRISLSRENGWIDENKRVYVYFKIETLKKGLRCGNTKACRLFKELETFGLIERKNQRLCKPSIIYVKDFTRFPNWERRTSQSENTGLPKTGTPEFLKWESNNTENNDTKRNDTNPILSGEDVDKDLEEREIYREILCENMEIELLKERNPYDKETIDAILDLMLDTICSKRKNIRIAGDDKPMQVVKSQFLKLDSRHMEYVLDCLRNNTAEVRNIKQYMLATIYNSRITIDSYYQQMVNHDMATGKI